MVDSSAVSIPDLSICIPTYNRQQLITRLVLALLECPGSFEIRVHDDGSSDGTALALLQVNDPRLHVTSGQNAGRAAALASAVSAAQGRFTMLFDDDDELYAEGLARVLEDCALPLLSDAAGYIYHLTDDIGRRLGSEFSVLRTNFLRLRNDLAVRGDKKEVVRTDLLRPIVMQTRDLGRRVPTSLYWATIALRHDIICRNYDIGRKHYEKGGMSDRIARLKRANPRPLSALYRIHAKGFMRGRFHSPIAATRAMFALMYHGTKSFIAKTPGHI